MLELPLLNFSPSNDMPTSSTTSGGQGKPSSGVGVLAGRLRHRPGVGSNA